MSMILPLGRKLDYLSDDCRSKRKRITALLGQVGPLAFNQKRLSETLAATRFVVTPMM